MKLFLSVLIVYYLLSQTNNTFINSTGTNIGEQQDVSFNLKSYKLYFGIRFK